MKNLATIVLLIACASLADAQSTTKDTAQTKTILNYAEVMPDAGYDIMQYLSEHLQYPDSAINNNIQGRVTLKFVVNEDGSISDCKVVKGIGGGCDREALRVVQAMPNWKPGMHNGKPANVWFTLPVSFKIAESAEINSKPDSMPHPDYDYQDYVSKNLRYPPLAKEADISGEVIIRFMVNENGSLSDFKVMRSVYGLLDDEAMRIIKNMPPWQPGKLNGKAVKVCLTMPVEFVIDGQKNKKKRKIDKPDDFIFHIANEEPDESPKTAYDYKKYIADHVNYPDAARRDKIQGDVSVVFTVKKDGTIENCIVANNLCASCDSEALRVVQTMPSWQPGIYNNKPVNAEMIVTVPFYPSEEAKRLAASEKIYTYVDKMPMPGYGYCQYFAENLKYPQSARDGRVQGQVKVKFIVTETGAIENPVVVQSLGHGCDEEAMRIIKNMPPWQPGETNGLPVKVYYTLPINFSIH